MTLAGGRIRVPDLGGRVETPVGDGAYVPKEVFISSDFAKLEAERLWPRVWQVACRVEDLPEIGSYVEYTIADQSILVIRTSSDDIKAFFNACRHRGAPLKSGSGKSQDLRCGYHGWRWNIDGSIQEITDAEDFDPACIDCDALRLPECHVATWGGFVFINMSRNPEPLETFLGPIASAMARYEPEKMRISRARTTVLPANWKTALFAFTDGYHTAAVHPQLLYYLDDTCWLYEAFESHGRFVSPKGSAGRPSPRLGDISLSPKEVLLTWLEDFDELDLFSDESAKMVREMAEAMPEGTTPLQFVSGIIRQAATASEVDTSRFTDGELVSEEVSTWALFPNVSAPMNPLAILFLRFRPDGLDPESCLMDVWNIQRFGDGYEPKPVESEFYPDWQTHSGWGRILSQDLRNIARAQKGLRSRGFERLICGRQDLVMRNHFEVLERYLGQP